MSCRYGLEGAHLEKKASRKGIGSRPVIGPENPDSLQGDIAQSALAGPDNSKTLGASSSSVCLLRWRLFCLRSYRPPLKTAATARTTLEGGNLGIVELSRDVKLRILPPWRLRFAVANLVTRLRAVARQLHLLRARVDAQTRSWHCLRLP